MTLRCGPRQDHYVIPQIDSRALAAQDPGAGLMCFFVYWQPDPSALNPEMPGRKVHITAFMPLRPGEPCLCGSGKPFGECCQTLPRCRLVCENYPRSTYNAMRPARALFRRVDGGRIKALLDDDTRIRCVEETPARRFWLYDGDPCYESAYGIQSFGDIELRDREDLIASALSETRMDLLLGFLKEVTGLDAPEITKDPPVFVDRPGRGRGMRRQ